MGKNPTRAESYEMKSDPANEIARKREPPGRLHGSIKPPHFSVLFACTQRPFRHWVNERSSI